MSMPECILLSENMNWKRTKYKNLGAKIMQHAKKLGFSVAENEFTASWNLKNLQEERDCFISNILDKCNLKEVQASLNKLNLWHTNQLLDNEQKRMVTWRQLKVREGKRYIRKKAKWFNVIENEILEDKKTRVIKEEYKEKKGFQVQEIEKKISRDKRKKE